MVTKDIGIMAGEVWKCLGKNGRMSITDLSNKVKGKEDLVYQALGWLARENKIDYTTEQRTTYVSLTKPESYAYQQTCSRK